MEPPADIFWIHVIRVIAVASVLMIHSSAEVFFGQVPFGGAAWWAADAYDSLGRPCIPLLFMISGCLLLGRTEPPAVFLKRRLRKIVIPLLFWSVVFIAWIHCVEGPHPSSVTGMQPNGYLAPIFQAGWWALVPMFWCPMYYHLWFLYVLVGLYLAIPILQIVVRHAPPGLLWYFLGLSAAALYLMPFIDFVTKIPTVIDLPFFAGSTGYLILGYLLARVPLSRRWVLPLALLGILSWFITVYGTYFLTAKDPSHVLSEQMWMERPNILGMAISAFLLIRWAFPTTPRQTPLVRLVRALSGASFGIYLIHVFFLYFLAEGWFGFRLTAMSGNPLLFIPLVAAAAYACTFAAVSLLHKARWLRPVMP